MKLDCSILVALVPVFLVILSGYLFRRIRFPGESFWPDVERLTYFALFPCLLIQKTASASLDLATMGPMAKALLFAVLAMAALLIVSRSLWSLEPRSYTSFFQGGIRFNTYVGLSAAYALFGDRGLTLAAVALAVLIPVINVLCVGVLIGFAHHQKPRGRLLLTAVTQNPLILACGLGILLNVSGIGLSPGVSDTLGIFGTAALPLGLLAVGAGLDMADARRAGKTVISNCAVKLIALPALMWMAARLFQVESTAAAVAVLFAALPGSGSSYILARQLGGDSTLMASIVTVQILLSMVTLPAVMALMAG